MFNHTLIPISVPERPVNVHIEQQPLDAADAARLYGELEAKAQLAVANATVARFGAENELTAVVIEHQRLFATDELQARVLFKLNGALYDLTLKPDRNDIAMGLYREVAIKLVESIMRKIASR